MHQDKFLILLLHHYVALGKSLNLFKPRGIIVPNLIVLARELSEVMCEKLLPQCLEIRVTVRDHYCLFSKICSVIMTL